MVSGRVEQVVTREKQQRTSNRDQSVQKSRCKRFLLARLHAAGPGLSELGARGVAGAGDEVVVYHAALDADEATPANRFEERNLPGNTADQRVGFHPTGNDFRWELKNVSAINRPKTK